MISRRMLVLTGFALVAAVPALAKEPVTWDEAAFDAAATAGFSIDPAPLRLLPQDKLVEIVRRSQDKALRDEGGEAGDG